MFELVLTKTGAGLRYGQEKLFDSIVPVIKVDTRESIIPAYQGCSWREGMDGTVKWREATLDYEVSELGVRVCAVLRLYDEYLLFHSTYESDWEVVGSKCVQLDATGGLVWSFGNGVTVDAVMGCYRHKEWWTRPYFGAMAQLPERTQSLLWKQGEEYIHILPVCDKVFTTELKGALKGFQAITSAKAGGFANVRTLSFVLGIGANPYRLSRTTAAAAARGVSQKLEVREGRRYPPIMEYAGWCSWDAFYYEVSAEGVQSKAEELHRLGLPIRWMILDAGWSDTRDNYLASFRARKETFPNGLGDLIGILKDKYGIRWVGAWHTLIGFWNGIDPEGELAWEYRHCLQETRCGKLVPALNPGQAQAFWSAWHKDLKQEGIDFVKVDYQSVLGNIMAHQYSLGEAAQTAHMALEASVGMYFDNQMINCMGMGTENIFHRPISSLSRNSDDFFPKEPGSFKEHALQNAYNSFYHGELYWGDWDMFWTRHESAVANGVLRALSGGPVYISDRVGETDPDLLWPLLDDDGRIYRCDQPGVPTSDCLLANPQTEAIPLKIWNRKGETGIVGVFNIHTAGGAVIGSVAPADVPGLGGDEFVLYEHFTKACKVLGKDERVDLILGEDEVRLYSLYPWNGKICPLGLVNKYVSAAAILEVREDVEGCCTIRLNEAGMFGFACERGPREVTVNGQPAGWTQSKEDPCLFMVPMEPEASKPMVRIIF